MTVDFLLCPVISPDKNKTPSKSHYNFIKETFSCSLRMVILNKTENKNQLGNL